MRSSVPTCNRVRLMCGLLRELAKAVHLRPHISCILGSEETARPRCRACRRLADYIGSWQRASACQMLSLMALQHLPLLDTSCAATGAAANHIDIYVLSISHIWLVELAQGCKPPQWVCMGSPALPLQPCAAVDRCV